MNGSEIEFLDAMTRPGLPEDERLILCGFPGNPDEAPKTAWRPRPWKPGREVPLGGMDNAYVTVSSFRVAPDGSWRRRGEGFAAGRALMVDDVGTKLPPDVVAALPASAVIETSPGNFQHWYFLETPQRSQDDFDALIRAFIAQKLLGADPGMSGVTRVGRLPGYINAKPKYGGAFRVRLTSLSGQLYDSNALVEAFKLTLLGKRRPLADRRLLPDDLKMRAELWVSHYNWLKSHRMLKDPEPDRSGWIQMRCPWTDGHTARADSGAAMREPAEDNSFYGAFRCHHGSCAERGWAELTDWIAEESAEELEEGNANEV